jgi:choline dehydrogenase
MQSTDADFLVIGGGSAGSIVAARLALAGHKTLLVEAGPPDRNSLIHIPAGVRYLLNNPKITWQDRTTANPQAGNRQLAWPHGRVIGGSGSINGMIFARGARADYDRWAQSGAKGWDFDSVLPHFKALESYAGRGGDHRGRAGPLAVEDARFRLPITRHFVEAAQAAGHAWLPDVNTPDPEGVGFAQMNRLGRFRRSSARAFLGLPRQSGNLRVETGWLATRLLFDARRCVGVEASRGGVRRTFRAARETVVSAGAIGSPHLLLLSGIGPGAALREHGVGVLHDLPGVGENLMDHYGARVTWRVAGAQTVNQLSHFPRLLPEILRWLITGHGVLTTGITTAMVFCRSDPALDLPDLQLLFTPTSFDQNRYGALERDGGISVTVCLSHPQSRGRISLASANPADRPLIDANYLASSHDLRVILNGIALTRRIAAHAPLSEYLTAETVPGADTPPEGLADHVRRNGVSIYHPCGTCKMGTDPMAVVDPRLRVQGLTGLRVADASVMPVITSGNTNAPTMMIGEKAASMMLEDIAMA